MAFRSTILFTKEVKCAVVNNKKKIIVQVLNSNAILNEMKEGEEVTKLQDHMPSKWKKIIAIQ